MKDIVLGLVMTAPFIFGFFVADRFGRFMDDDHAGRSRPHTHERK